MNRLLLALALTGVWAALAWEMLTILGPDWTLFAPATCLGTHCFCEGPRAGQLLLQPANSLSSLGFVAAGAWIMLGAGRDRGSALGTLPMLWFGLTAIIIGLGSALFHATLTLWGQFADVLGMYLLGSFTLVWAVQRWRGWSHRIAVIAYVILAGTLIALLWLGPETRRWLFALVLLASILIEWFAARPRRREAAAHLFLLAVAANFAAFALWIPDQTLALCARESWWQGHAAWHLLGAVSVLFTAGYYHSERRI